MHWSRRLSAAEAAAVAVDEQTNDMRVLVYACGTHAITLDLAAHIHQSTCSGPNAAALPACDCTPEPLPVPPVLDTTTLASGWQIAT